VKIVEKHAAPLRVIHWLNVPFIALMIWSGLMIYWANDVYPFFFPEWFYQAFNLQQRLAEGLSLHFLFGWLFVLNGLAYLIWFAASRHWRELVPRCADLKWIAPTILHDLGLRKEAPPKAKFNAVQKVAYTSLILMAVLAVLSGFAIYKPVQLSWLAALFGGYEGARLVHFLMMIGFCLFIVTHVVQVARAGWNNFRAMVAGYEVEND
jgi:thiosulfate reductase cytochrome b subunit